MGDRINEEKEEEDAKEAMDGISAVNDTESVMYKLSKMGLRIQPNIRRSHSFQIYETVSLQKQAAFSNVISTSPSPSFSSFRPFGSGMVGANNDNNVQSMRWPKLSIFSQQSSNKNAMAICVSQSNSNKKTKRAKKRSH